MEENGNVECSPRLSEGDVSKYSAILVATIQEAKDRISQLEYVFCNHLYTNFQFQSKHLKKICLDAKKEVEDMWKKKESGLLLQIEKLQLENRQVVEEIRCLKVENENLLNFKEKCQSESGDGKKCVAVVEGNEERAELIDRDRTNELLATVSSLENKVEELKGVVKEKMVTVAEKKELANGLMKNIEFLVRHGAESERLSTTLVKENKQCDKKFERLEDSISELQRKLGEKTQEVEKGRALQEKLLQQNDMNNVEMSRLKLQLELSENEKKVLIEKINSLEKEINELKENGSTKLAEVKDLNEKLLKQIEAKDSELLTKKKRLENIVDAYKRLKSQYIYLCNKSGLTEESMRPQIKLDEESDTSTHQRKLQRSPGSKHRDISAEAMSGMKKVKIENEASECLEGDKMVKAIPVSSFCPPTSICVVPKCPPTAKPVPLTGTKRSASRWIETRSHQGRGRSDPHDDFLDTPLENFRGTLNKASEEKVHDPQIPFHENPLSDSSDDETQDVSVDPGAEKQQVPLAVPAQKAIKYVEPIRKKAERENLQGVECKQCKKFYDAIHSDGSKDADGKNKYSRCEHHDGVSRHRYKYVPPLTPEGFWNIGFESEM